LFKDIASFDSRILRTAIALFAQPGELSLAFHEGRTQRYVPAVRLYLFISLIFFLFLSITSTAILQLEIDHHQSPLFHQRKTDNSLKKKMVSRNPWRDLRPTRMAMSSPTPAKAGRAFLFTA